MSRQLSLMPVLLLAVVPMGCSGPPTPLRPRVDSQKPEPTPGPATKAAAPDKTTVPVPAPPPPNPNSTITKEDGVIRGVVRWSGPLPGPDSAAPREDWFVTISGRKVAVQPAFRLQVDPQSKGVANVAVWLLRAPAFPLEGVAPAPPEPVRLSQREGNFVPHVLVAQQGAELRLGTTDDEADFQTSGAIAVSVRLNRGQSRPVALPRVGVVEVRSEARPWMTPAFLHVVEHGYHAVTDPDGQFRLPAVPPGEYEVLLWHEGWGPGDAKNPGAIDAVRARVRVNLEPDQGAVVEWLLTNP
jgi:hypothetical protein